jgi:gas vesicle protein
VYGKIFDTVFTGTLYGSGPTVFAVWAYVIATAKPPGVVEINPKLLAGCIGTDVGDIKKAIDLLCAPDSDSRNPDSDGCRLIHMGGLQYEVVSFQKYRDMVSMEDKRLADRQRMAEKRASMRVSQIVANSRKESQPVAEVAETEAETETEVKAVKKKNTSPSAPSDVSPSTWADFQTIRKAKKAPITGTTLAGIRREAERAGMTLDAALQVCCERGWQSFNADWVPKTQEAVLAEVMRQLEAEGR